MWILNKLDEFIVSLDTEIDEDIEYFMYETYYYTLQFSLLSLNVEKKYKYLLILYLLLFSGIIIFTYISLFRAWIYFYRFNFVIFSYITHIVLLLKWLPIIIITFLNKGKKIYYIHRIAMNGFYDYHESILQDEEEELLVEMLRKKNLLLLYPVFILIIGVTFLITTQVVDSYGTFDFDSIANVSSIHHPFWFGIYPFPVNSGISYLLVLVSQIISSLHLTMSIASLGLVFITVAQGIIFQLKRLALYLENIEKRAMEMFLTLYDVEYESIESLYASPEFSYCYNNCLRKTFVHHQMIIRYFNISNKIFSLIGYAGYIVDTISIALSLCSSRKFSELPGTSFLSMLLCIGEVGIIFISSYFGQIITDLSSDLRFKMYSTKWYYCNASTKRSLMIFQARTLQPLTIKAGGLIPVNMVFFATVMNSAYSYYNLVNAFNVDLNQS